MDRQKTPSRSIDTWSVMAGLANVGPLTTFISIPACRLKISTGTGMASASASGPKTKIFEEWG